MVFKDFPGLCPVVQSPITIISWIKVTVQLETEGNSQNEIISHMERSEVKL